MLLGQVYYVYSTETERNIKHNNTKLKQSEFYISYQYYTYSVKVDIFLYLFFKLYWTLNQKPKCTPQKQTTYAKQC